MLTHEGNHLWQKLSGPFRAIESTVDQMRQKSSSQQVNLICRPFFSSFWMASRLHSFWAAYPRVSLNLIHQNTLAASDFDRADLAVTWGKAPPANMIAVPLVSAGLSPIMHISLAGRLGVPQCPADLKNFTLLHEETRLGWTEWFDHAGAPATEGRQSYLIDDTNVRYQSMLSGQGIMLGAAALLKSQIESGELIQPFDIVLNEYRYWLVHPRGRSLPARCQTLIDWLQKEVAQSSRENAAGEAR